MGEFFRGWRRKIGVVTLIMSLAFMGGWVRSNFVADIAQMFTPSVGQRLTMQTHGRCILIEISRSSEQRSYANGGSSSLEASAAEDSEPYWLFGVRECHGETVEGIRFIRGYVLIMPFHAIVVPLTLVSAYLLLSKPRKSTQNKIAEPIPVEGT